MAYSWKIKKAAVEQVIEFPNKKALSNWANNLCKRNKTYEIVCKKQHEDGRIDAVVRIPYNNNLFLGSADDDLCPDAYF